ncbi:MAG TPA: small basic protein [Verrucomicrobia bacterium]|nr:small basic protein [Verrucomicrobiota bacterium]
MSQHASFKSASKITIKRNVLKRFERIDVLRSQGRWKEGDRGHGLPKTKTI